VVFYDTPELWGGFTGRIAYSFSPSATGVSGVSGATGIITGQANQTVAPAAPPAFTTTPPATSADIGVNARKGRAWNLNPNWSANGLNLGISNWSAKMDNPNGYASNATASMDQSATRAYGSYLFAFGLRVGLAYDQSKLKGAQSTGGLSTVAGANGAAAIAANGVTLSKRSTWSLPVSYAWGPYEIHAHYDKAGNDKGAGFTGLDAKSSMFAVSGQYNLSKRTSLALNYAQINNHANATYNFFTSTSLGSADAGLKAGEDPRLWSLTVRHAF
jgi:general bacterial porin, GBP family